MATHEDLGNETLRIYEMEGFKLRSLLWDVEHYMRRREGKSTFVSESGKLPNEYKAEHTYRGARVNIQTHQGKQFPAKTNIDLVVKADNTDTQFAVCDDLSQKLARLELWYERNPDES